MTPLLSIVQLLWIYLTSLCYYIIKEELSLTTYIPCIKTLKFEAPHSTALYLPPYLACIAGGLIVERASERQSHEENKVETTLVRVHSRPQRLLFL